MTLIAERKEGGFKSSMGERRGGREYTSLGEDVGAKPSPTTSLYRRGRGDGALDPLKKRGGQGKHCNVGEERKKKKKTEESKEGGVMALWDHEDPLTSSSKEKGLEVDQGWERKEEIAPTTIPRGRGREKKLGYNGPKSFREAP